jgi:hypothetical protein
MFIAGLHVCGGLDDIEIVRCGFRKNTGLSAR